MGSPFLPAVSPGDSVEWTRPVQISEDRFLIGEAANLYIVNAGSKSSLQQVVQLEVDGKLKSGLAASGDVAMGVYSLAGVEKLVALKISDSDLTVAGSKELPGVVTGGPWMVGQQVLVRMDNNQLVSFDSATNQKWVAEVGAGTLAAAPVENGGAVNLYFSDGRMLSVNGNSGDIDSEFNLGQPISHSPISVGGKTLVPGLDGTLHNVPALQ